MIVNYGDILKDQTGQVMDRGENACFLVCEQYADKNIGFSLLEIPENSSRPMGPKVAANQEMIDGMKYVGNLCKMVWAEI